MAKLDGKRVVITGAANGIGLAIAERFAAEGAALFLVDLDEAALSKAAQRLGARQVVADLSSTQPIAHIVADAVAALGGVDILVNNVGVIHRAGFFELQESDFDRVMSINLKSALFMSQAIGRLMADQGSGAIINMSSVNAVLAIPDQIPYAVSKGALRQLTNVSAIALAPYGVRVNAIGPGTVETNLARQVISDAAAEARVLSRTPLGRKGTTDEIASVALFLACDDSSYITGQTIYPDGGRLGLNYTMPTPQ